MNPFDLPRMLRNIFNPDTEEQPMFSRRQRRYSRRRLHVGSHRFNESAAQLRNRLSVVERRSRQRIQRMSRHA